jgi:hypothetical protein
MASLKRKKQQLNQGIKGTLNLMRNKTQNTIVTIQNKRLLSFTKEFI